MGPDAAIYLGSTASGVSRCPHWFAQALGKELRETHPEKEAILQHADSMSPGSPGESGLVSRRQKVGLVNLEDRMVEINESERIKEK